MAFLAGFAWSAVARAQAPTTGELFGVVVAPAGASADGVLVEVTGPQGSRSTRTDARGAYRFEHLPPGLYSLVATADGLRSRVQGGIHIEVGTRLRLRVSLEEIPEHEETIVVRATAEPVEIDATGIRTVVSRQVAETVPTGRSFVGLAKLAPGVTDAGGTGPENPSISGASGLENVYFVDGVNITNTGYGSLGSYSVKYGSMGTGVNFDFVDVVEVKSAAFEAEWGQALGGVVNVVTRSGSNELRGALFAYAAPRGLRSHPRRIDLVNGYSRDAGEQAFDLGAWVSGPVVRDRLFFFGAINPQQRTVWREAPQDFPLASLGVEATQLSQTSYAAKLTWLPRGSHRVELSAFGDPGASRLGPQSGNDLLRNDTGGFSRLDFGGHSQVIRYSGTLGSRTSVEAQVARSTNRFDQSADDSAWSIIDYRPQHDGLPVLVSGGAGEMETTVGENIQYHAKATHYLQGWGQHEIKYGLGYEDVRFTMERRVSGPSVLVDLDRGTYPTTTGVMVFIDYADDGVTPIYRAMWGSLENPHVATHTDYVSFFAQDKWSPIDDLTLDLGLRVEQQRIIGTDLDYVFPFKDNLAPRLGVSWDFTGRGRGKVFGHYGRYIEKIPNLLAANLLSFNNTVVFTDYYDPELTQPVPNGEVPYGSWGTLHRFVYELGAGVEKGTKSQYQDEWVAGIEYSFAAPWLASMRYIHRELGRVVEDYQLQTADGILQGTEFFNVFYRIGNPGSHLNDRCPAGFENCWRDPVRRYDALELTLQRRLTDGWTLLGSYRLSRLFGNYEGLFNNDTGDNSPNNSAAFDFPNNTPLMKNASKPGVLPTDRTHVGQLAVSYLSPRGFSAGIGYRIASGTPRTSLLAHPIYRTPGDLPAGDRGDIGRNPTLQTIDVHLGDQFNVRRGMQAHVSIDVFNLLDTQTPVLFADQHQLTPEIANPDAGQVVAYQPPRSVRLGFKLTF